MSIIRRLLIPGVFSLCAPLVSGVVLSDETPTMAEVQSSVQSGDYAAAVEKARAITEAQPNNANAWFFLGYALHAGGEIDRAIEAHERAAAFPQTAAPATYNLACAYAIKGRHDDAFAALDRAARLGVRDPDQYRNDTDLAPLREDDRWDALIASVEDLNANPPESWLAFWAGSWDCYVQSGAKAGSNTLTLRLGGRVLHEQWTPSTGSPGESWNYYDPGAGVWRQTWIETGGSVTHFAGKPKDGGVFFEGQRVGVDGSTSKTTMFVRPIGDRGWVRQTGGLLQPDGSMTQRYDLVYVPSGQTFVTAEVAW